jgi:hypothetical protein
MGLLIVSDTFYLEEETKAENEERATSVLSACKRASSVVASAAVSMPVSGIQSTTMTISNPRAVVVIVVTLLK